MKRPSPITYDLIDDTLKRAMKKGTYCSHCGQYVKEYVKPLGAPIARFLIRLYRAHQHFGDDRFFTTRELFPRDNKASTEGVVARYWDLIEVADATNSGGAPVGAYRLTVDGRRFVQGLHYVKSHARTYNGELLELDGNMVNIQDALGKKWNYDELMREV